MLVYSIYSNIINPIECRSNYSSAQNNTKLVHWPLMGGLLHLVQQRGAWAGPQPTQAPPCLPNVTAHRPLMGGLLHLVQQRAAWAGPQPTQAPPCLPNVTAHP